MKKISILLLIVISLVLFIPQFYLLGFIRNLYFEDFWKQYLNKLEVEDRETISYLESWNSELDPSDPKTFCSYKTSKELKVIFDFKREIVENFSTGGLKKSIHGLLDFYGNKYAYHRVLWVEHLTATGTVFITRVYYEDNLLNKSQFTGKNFCELFLKSVSEWEKAGGKREGDWFKEYKKSKQYENYVDEVLEQLENPEGKSLEETYNEIMNLQKSEGMNLSLMDFFLYDYILKYYKEYAKLAYKRYSDYVEEGDFYSAVFYSYFISYLHHGWHVMQKLNWWEIHRLEYQLGSMYNSNIYTDFFGIFLSSLLISFVVTKIILKNYLKNDENDVPKNESKEKI